MKLSTRGKYGVRALFEIARNYGHGPLSIKEIADRQRISLSYLEQILHRLGKAGIIMSVRGPHGGYELGKEPEELTIGDVVRALEGPIALSHCLEPGEDGVCLQADACVAKMVWENVGKKIEEAMDGITFSDLLKQARTRTTRDLPLPKKKTAAAGKGVC